MPHPAESIIDPGIGRLWLEMLLQAAEDAESCDGDPLGCKRYDALQWFQMGDKHPLDAQAIAAYFEVDLRVFEKTELCSLRQHRPVASQRAKQEARAKKLNRRVVIRKLLKRHSRHKLTLKLRNWNKEGLPPSIQAKYLSLDIAGLLLLKAELRKPTNRKEKKDAKRKK